MKNADTSSSHVVCELCGQSPRDRYVRDQAARDCRMRYRVRRSQRVLIWSADDPVWAQYRDRLAAAGMDWQRWAGRRVCPDCYARFTAALDTTAAETLPRP